MNTTPTPKIPCSQPGNYQEYGCNCESCKNQDRIEHVRSEVSLDRAMQEREEREYDFEDREEED